MWCLTSYQLGSVRLFNQYVPRDSYIRFLYLFFYLVPLKNTNLYNMCKGLRVPHSKSQHFCQYSFNRLNMIVKCLPWVLVWSITHYSVVSVVGSELKQSHRFHHGLCLFSFYTNNANRTFLNNNHRFFSSGDINYNNDNVW